MTTSDIRTAELTRIYKRDKCVQASVVVQEAKPKSSPIHDEFTWSDKEAGHQYRLGQARQMIRITPIRMETGVIQRLVHVPSVTLNQPTAQIVEREGVYKPIREVAKDQADCHAALGELMAKLRAAERAVMELKNAAGANTKLLPTLSDALKVAKQTVRLMMQEAA